MVSPDRSFPDFVTIFQLHWSSKGGFERAGRGIVKRAAKIAFRMFGGSLLVDLEDSEVLCSFLVLFESVGVDTVANVGFLFLLSMNLRKEDGDACIRICQ